MRRTVAIILYMSLLVVPGTSWARTESLLHTCLASLDAMTLPESINRELELKARGIYTLLPESNQNRDWIASWSHHYYKLQARQFVSVKERVPLFLETLEWMKDVLVKRQKIAAEDSSADLYGQKQITRHLMNIALGKVYSSLVPEGPRYSDMIEISALFSIIMGRLQTDSTATRAEAFTSFGSLAQIRSEWQKYFDYSHLSDPIKKGPKELFYIPTHRKLGLEEFNATSGIAVAFLGLSELPVVADGMKFDPDAFYGHDILHASLVNLGKLQALNWATANKVNLSELYKVYLEMAASQDEVRLRNLLWFYVSHEDARFLPELKKKKFEDAETYFMVNALDRRTSKPDDLGMFLPERPRSWIAELEKLHRLISAAVISASAAK